VSSKTLSSFGSPRRAAARGARRALGLPALILGATYVGFGSLVRESGLGLWHGLLSTASAWAAPGQIALVELYAVGASLLVIGTAVALSNVRLMPMTVALIPELRAPGTGRWKYYLAAHYIAVTGWAEAMRVCPGLKAEERLSYFVGFSATLWSVSLGATALGFYLAGTLPAYLTLGLVFVNPIYFMLVFVTDLSSRARMLALILGAVLGPLLHLVTADWGLLLTGLLAGSVAFFGERAWRRRHG
jgi:predicted branched-subunit amino acid permease